jgi:hypothetical protein
MISRGIPEAWKFTGASTRDRKWMPPPKAGAKVQPVRAKENSLRREPSSLLTQESRGTKRENSLSEIAALLHCRITAGLDEEQKR